MSDIGNIALSAQNVVVAINALRSSLENTMFKAPLATSAGIGTAAAAGAGAMRFVTDATVTTRLATYAGGGTNKVILFSDGASWLIL